MGLSNADHIRRWRIPATLTCLSVSAFAIAQYIPVRLGTFLSSASVVPADVASTEPCEDSRRSSTSEYREPHSVLQHQPNSPRATVANHPAADHAPAMKEFAKASQAAVETVSDPNGVSRRQSGGSTDSLSGSGARKSLTTFSKSGATRTIPKSIPRPAQEVEQVIGLQPGGIVIDASIPIPVENQVPANRPVREFPQEIATQEIATQSALFSAGPESYGRLDAAVAEQATERSRVGRLVSQRNLGITELPGPDANPLKPIESPLGWAAIEQELRSRLERCESLLARGAIFSARQEAIEGLRYLTQAIDGRQQSDRHARALAMAIQALREELDFVETVAVPTEIDTAGSVGLIEHYVKSHITPVLKDRKLSGVSPIVAAQYYRAFAREQFAIAMDGIVWGADLLYAYGKSLEAQSNENSALRIVYLQQAQAVYESALLITPRHALNANQLGYVLLKLDRPVEARDRLLESIEAMPTTVAWQNLTEAFRRLNDRTGIAWANDNYARSLQRPNAIDPTLPQVTEVPPEQFIAISPRALSNGPESIRQSSSPAFAHTNRFEPGAVSNNIAPMAEQPPAQAIRTSPTPFQPPAVPETANRSWLFPWLR